ncbi:interactor of constitutive active ROPs 3-like [Salvia miltiorrhiza]|uniref:interactor of constitutive active ROPs 3-like n=1 Tax=Salvia miltiorrhiza TaxID=226208 RepID=UPI0025AD5374|nr:interactor of constitutive active ROPs 3-like [Salvia miltiorrhiza]
MSLLKVRKLLRATEAYNAIAAELEQSRARVNFLEDLVSKLKDSQREDVGETEVSSLKLEVEQLRSALEAGEIRYNEERSHSAEQIRDAMETVEKFKSASSQREAELEVEIRRSKYEIEELKANLMDKETELQGICEENEGLTTKLESSVSGQRENELKEMMSAGEVEESARAAEREVAVKVSYMAEEVEKSNRKAARVGEQLEAVQAANAEMEGELRRLKVQSDQWRKAAEAAAAMLSAGNNGQMMERTGSMDSHYNSPRTGKISSPYGDELDEELMKKKNANMLRRFGVLWKKPQK